MILSRTVFSRRSVLKPQTVTAHVILYSYITCPLYSHFFLDRIFCSHRVINVLFHCDRWFKIKLFNNYIIYLDFTSRTCHGTKSNASRSTRYYFICLRLYCPAAAKNHYEIWRTREWWYSNFEIYHQRSRDNVFLNSFSSNVEVSTPRCVFNTSSQIDGVNFMIFWSTCLRVVSNSNCFSFYLLIRYQKIRPRQCFRTLNESKH